MTKHIDKDVLIEKFLEHTLSIEELRLFKEKWNTDSDFVKEVRDYANLAVTLKAVKKINQDDKNPSLDIKIEQTNPILNYWKVAAAILLLLMATPLYFILRSPSPQKLAKDYFIDHRLYSLRDAAKANETPFGKALRAYNNGQKQEAIILMKQVKAQENEAYLFTLADLFLKAGQADSAIYYYEKGRAYNPVDPYTQWNNIMAHLQRGKVDIAKVMLKDLIIADKAPYGQKAKALLQVLENPGFQIKLWFN